MVLTSGLAAAGDRVSVLMRDDQTTIIADGFVG
jgi:hypothetical protein